MNAERTTKVVPASSQSAAGVAWLLCGLALALVACAAGLEVLNGTGIERLLFLISVISGAVVGGLVASRRPTNPIGWFFLGSTLSFATIALTHAYATYGLLTDPGSLPLARAMAWPGSWLWVPAGVLILVFVPLYFPDGRLVSRRWRWVVRLAVFFCAFGAVFSALQPGKVGDSGLINPLGVEALRPVSEMLSVGVLSLWLGLLFVSAASLVVRFRRSGSEERQQIKWLAFAASVIPVWFLVSPAVEAVALTLFVAVDSLVFAGIPVAVGIAIFKYRLYDIDLIINRTLVYGALTACVIGIYVLVVGYLGALLRTDDLFVSLIATGAVAVLFAPLRDRLQRGVNRLMYGDRDHPYAALSRLGKRLETTLAPSAVLPTAVRTVAEALKSPYVAVELERNGTYESVAATGERPAERVLRLPLAYGGETVGRLVLGLRPGEEDFSTADRRLLDDLARQIGVAVHATRLTEEALRLSADLQKSRERLVSAREEERRRLRRDLHDGLGPQLASLTMKSEAARDLMESSPARSVALLEEIITQAQEAVTDVRRLVYGLRPPALDDLGLLGALRAQASHSEHGDLRVTVEAPERLPPLPAAVEVAAYRIAQEALTNAVYHAGARNCTVCIVHDEQERALRLEITDDGRGIPEDRSAGVGLQSMRERAEELGGSCRVEALPSGGTSVRAVLPLAQGLGEAEALQPGVREV